MAVGVVLAILLLTTFSVQVTILVMISVLLVTIYTLTLQQVWGVDFNFMSAIQLSFALGVSLDYSSHIAHAYLVAQAPPTCVTDAQKRDHKARQALSKMGSSVIHGGNSTLLGFLALSQAELYSFIVVYKSWVGIICFGLLNGLILLPVLLSLFGPINFGTKV